MLDLVPGNAAGERPGGRAPGRWRAAVIRIGASRSFAPRSTSAGPNASPSCVSRCRKWLIMMMPLRAAMPSTVRNPTSDPSDSTPPVEPRCEHAADQRQRQQSGTSAQPAACCRRRPAAVAGSPTAAAMRRTTISRCCAACRSVDSPRTSAWYSRGNCTSFTTLLDIGRRRSPGRALDVGADVDPAGRSSRSIVVGRRRDATSATSAERHPRRRRRVDRQVLDVGQAVARLPGAPHVHVVGLSAVEDVADLLAGDQRRRRPADVAGLQPVALRRLEVDRDLDLRHDRSETRRAGRSTPSTSPILARRPRRPCRAAPRGRARRCAPRSPRSVPVSTSLIRSCR